MHVESMILTVGRLEVYMTSDKEGGGRGRWGANIQDAHYESEAQRVLVPLL